MDQKYKWIIAGVALMFLLIGSSLVEQNSHVPQWDVYNHHVWMQIGDADGPGIVSARFSQAVGYAWTATVGVSGWRFHVGLSKVDLYNSAGKLVRKAYVPDFGITNWYDYNTRTP